jgi:hypothetical protein
VDRCVKSGGVTAQFIERRATPAAILNGIMKPAASSLSRSRSRHADPACAHARLATARLNPLLNVILAFWAIWHCRHARPPLFSLPPLV